MVESSAARDDPEMKKQHLCALAADFEFADEETAAAGTPMVEVAQVVLGYRLVSPRHVSEWCTLVPAHVAAACDPSGAYAPVVALAAVAMEAAAAFEQKRT